MGLFKRTAQKPGGRAPTLTWQLTSVSTSSLDPSTITQILSVLQGYYSGHIQRFLLIFIIYLACLFTGQNEVLCISWFSQKYQAIYRLTNSVVIQSWSPLREATDHVTVFFGEPAWPFANLSRQLLCRRTSTCRSSASSFFAWDSKRA